MEIIYEILTELHPEYDFSDNGGTIDEGVLDSFDLISLVTMLEERFNIMIDALEIVPEHFRSVEEISKLVRNSGGTV